MSCEWVSRILVWFGSLNFSNWIEIIKIGCAAIAFAIGLRQYRRSQVWKRLEFVSAQMKIFFDDRAVRATMHMLDWRKKKMPLYKFRDEDDDDEVTVVIQGRCSRAGHRRGVALRQKTVRDKRSLRAISGIPRAI